MAHMSGGVYERMHQGETGPESSGFLTSLLKWLSLDLRSAGTTTWSLCFEDWRKDLSLH